MKPQDSLSVLHEHIKAKEKFWRDQTEDPHNIALAVRIALAETASAVEGAIAEFEDLEDIVRKNA